MTARRTLWIIALAVVVTACGGGGGYGRWRTAPATEEGLLSTARAYTEAFRGNQRQTYDFLSETCQSSVTRAEWAMEMLFAGAWMETIFGFGLDDLDISSLEVVSFDGDSGLVAVTYTGPGGDPLNDEPDPSAWRYENGGWVTDECDTADSGSTPEVPAETALTWPAKFCELREGMTREEVRAIMGAPTTEFLDESSQDSYSAYQFNITIFYNSPRAQDPDPMKVRVRSLSPEITGQYTDMTLDDIAMFPCADEVFDEATIDAARANSGD